MGKIIELKTKKPFSRERYENDLEKERINYKQKMCSHAKVVVDIDEDEVECEECGRTMTSYEYVSFKVLDQSPLTMESYNLQNKIYFLKEEVEKLESTITYLKTEKRTLTREVNKIKKRKQSK